MPDADGPYQYTCTVRGCGKTATYRVTFDESLLAGKVRVTQVMCDQHAYDHQRYRAAVIWALNE